MPSTAYRPWSTIAAQLADGRRGVQLGAGGGDVAGQLGQPGGVAAQGQHPVQRAVEARLDVGLGPPAARARAIW